MTHWSEIFLGVIAVATLTTAVIQVGVLVAAGLAVRRVVRLLDRVERELQPALGHVNAISRDAAKAVSLATAQVERADKVITVQVERADRIVTDLAQKVEDTVATVHARIVAPVRDGKALLVAFRAAFDVLRDSRRRSRSRRRSEEDDALFI